MGRGVREANKTSGCKYHSVSALLREGLERTGEAINRDFTPEIKLEFFEDIIWRHSSPEWLSTMLAM